jgi:CRISPR/Cas system type I-B associated protein Csh2 (Cas7 group RAMP superfamily)
VLVAIGVWAMNKEDPSKPQKPKSLDDVAVINNHSDNSGVNSQKTPEEKSANEITITTMPNEIKETPKENTQAPKEVVKETINEAIKETPKEEIKFLPPDETKAVVEVSFDELKSKLAKGFKVRVGVLDELNQHLKLDDIKLLIACQANKS